MGYLLIVLCILGAVASIYHMKNWPWRTTTMILILSAFSGFLWADAKFDPVMIARWVAMGIVYCAIVSAFSDKKFREKMNELF